MNRKLGILSLFLSVLFAGCSSEEPTVNEGGENNGKDLGYIAVSIAQPRSVVGRGASDDGFENGTADENEAKEATFFVFDQSNQCKSVQTIALTSSKDGSGDTKPYVGKIYDAVLVFDKFNDEDKYSGEIFCVLNAPTQIKTLTTATTKRSLFDMVKDYCTNYRTAGTFIMTNSAYRTKTGNTESEVCGAEFSANDFKSSANEALDNPIEIYVERVVAKVNTSKGSDWDTNNQGVTDPVNEGKKLTIRITGIEIANIAPNAYLFKNLGSVYTTWPQWEWETLYDVDNYRCYWEDIPNIQPQDFLNKRYSEITNTTPTDKIYPELESYSITEYIQPNTSKSNNNTCVLVTAQLLNKISSTNEEDATTDTYSPADLVWMMGGYIDNTGAKNILCQYLATEQYAVQEKSNDGNITYTQITAADLKWAQKQNIEGGTEDIANLKPYQAVAQISLAEKTDITRTVVKYDFVKKEEIKNNGVAYTIYDADNYLASDPKFFAEVFKDGLCYYYMNIDQSYVIKNRPDETDACFGVVRNHIYNLELSSIRGIGTAVFDPERKIIPDKPSHDNFSYLAARINVLPWKLVNQKVSFEGN